MDKLLLATSTFAERIILSVTTYENEDCVAKPLNDDKRYTCDEITYELHISHG